MLVTRHNAAGKAVKRDMTSKVRGGHVYSEDAFERPAVEVVLVGLCLGSDALEIAVSPTAEQPHLPYRLPWAEVTSTRPMSVSVSQLVEDAGTTGTVAKQLRAINRQETISISYAVPLVTPAQPTVPVIDAIPNLSAHDRQVADMAIDFARRSLWDSTFALGLLPERFTLLDAQRVHEAVLGEGLKKDTFRRKMLASGLVEPTGAREEDVDHRPAELFRTADHPTRPDPVE